MSHTFTCFLIYSDGAYFFLFSLIRQQLTNTEGIRRVRKKAPCTIPEILMLQRQALEDGFLKEPIFTGKFTNAKKVDCSIQT